jgi:hypothetical protein
MFEPCMVRYGLKNRHWKTCVEKKFDKVFQKFPLSSHPRNQIGLIIDIYLHLRRMRIFTLRKIDIYTCRDF